MRVAEIVTSIILPINHACICCVHIHHNIHILHIVHRCSVQVSMVLQNDVGGMNHGGMNHGASVSHFHP